MLAEALRLHTNHTAAQALLTSLPGDSLQSTGAGWPAGVKPQAASAVRRLLAGLALDAATGVLQGRQQAQPNANSPGGSSSPRCRLSITLLI